MDISLKTVLFFMMLSCTITFNHVCAVSSTTSSTTTTTSSTSSGGVRLPPMIIVSPTSGSYRPSASVQLQCGATGYPTPTFSWTYNTVPLTVNQSNIIQQSGGNILINPVSTSNTGYYQCMANNLWGTAVSSVSFVQVATMGNFPSQTTANTLAAQVGQSLGLTCNAAPSSQPAAQFAWSIVQSLTSTVGSAVQLSSRIQVGLDGALYFANVLSTDESLNGNLYACNLHNSVLDLTVGGSYTSLSVTGNSVGNTVPSYAFSSSSPTAAVVGQSFTLYCFYYGNPTPTLAWSLQGGSLPSGRYTINNYNTELTITNVQTTDAGIYICTASNTQGSATTQIQVNVFIAPTFLSSSTGPIDVNATNGDTVSFDCSFSSNPQAQIIWYQNSNPLNPSSLPTGYSLSADKTVLTVSDVCKVCSDGSSDLAVIQCNVSNSYGFAYGQAYLNVLDSTVISSGPQNQTVAAGTTTSLVCQVSSDPSTPVNITWYLGNDEVYSTTNSLTSSYYLINAQPSNGGVYTCFATNGYSNASYSFGFIVTPAIVASVGDYWYIFLIIGLLLLLLLLIIFLYFYHRHNIGESYPVDEVEKENGNDPVKDLQAADFHDYQRPEGIKAPMPGLPAQQTSLGASNYYGNADGESVTDGGQFNDGESYAGQQYAPSFATGTTFSPPDVVVSSAPAKIQLNGAPNTGGHHYYNAQEPTTIGADLDAAFDDGSVVGSEHQPQQPYPRPGLGYAGSMPMLNDDMKPMPPRRQIDDQRRRVGGSAPTLLDDTWALQPTAFPNDDDNLSSAANFTNAGNWTSARPAAIVGYPDRVDGWIDNESDGDQNPMPPSYVIHRPAPLPPARPVFGYSDVSPAVTAADDVFPVMYDADDRQSDRAATNYGYDNDFNDGYGRDVRGGPAYSRNASTTRTPSESSV